MEFEDRTLRCVLCGRDFVFTAGEQLFFHSKQFKNDPKHCKSCSAKIGRTTGKVRLETQVTCAHCGSLTTVPFKPTKGKPVLCRACFQMDRDNHLPSDQAKPQEPSGDNTIPHDPATA